MDDKDESLIAHLEALRRQLIKCLTAVGIGLLPMFFAAPYVIEQLIKLMSRSHKLTLNYFSPMEVFLLQIKTALVLDLLICFPYIARKIWDFILPALYENERKFIRSVVLFSSLLFAVGAVFCLFFILPLLIDFGLSFTSENIKAVLGVSNVMTTALQLAVVFGLMFQFPLITYSLIRWGIVSYEGICEKRRFVVVGILIIAALLTPPDIVSQMMLFFPTYLLFESGLFFARKYKNTDKGKKSIDLE